MSRQVATTQAPRAQQESRKSPVTNVAPSKEERLAKSKISIFLAILWVAEADAPLTRSQFSKLLKIFLKFPAAFGGALVASQSVTADRLEESFREIYNQSNSHRKQIFIAAVTATTIDREIGPAAWHSLALLADVCARGIGGEELLQITFRELKVKLPAAIPRPDLVSWWKSDGARWETGLNELPVGTPQSKIDQLVALQILGLGPNASQKEIELSFRQRMLALSPDQTDGRPPKVIEAARNMAALIRRARQTLKDQINA